MTSHTKTSKFGIQSMSFVGLRKPFVGTKNLIVIPFVGPKYPNRGRSVKGFTLVELLVTLAVLGILVLIGIPNMRAIIQNNRIATLTNDLLSDINLARSEALKRATNVGICMSSAGIACDGASWTGGRMVFADTNNNQAFDAGEPVLRAREAMASTTLTTAEVPNPLIFNARGIIANTTTDVSYSLCDDRGTSKGRSIKIKLLGQTSSSTNPASC